MKPQTLSDLQRFLAKGLEIRQKKSMLAGLMKYLLLARMDYTVPRFTV